MYSMVLMAALATGAGAPDFGFYGFGNMGWNGWGGYGLGWGGWGGYGMGWGGYGLGWGGLNGWGWGNGGYGYSPWYSGYGYSPWYSGYGYSPAYSAWGWGGSPWYSAGASSYPGMTRSLYYNPAMDNPAREARLIVHVPPQARLTIDDYPTMSRSDTRVFNTPPLDPGKTYTYTLRGELNRDGRFVHVTKTVEVKGGELTDVTLRFSDTNSEELGAPTLKGTSSK